MAEDQKLMLLFECGNEKYAIECNDVVEVIPNLQTDGYIQYHGKQVPVVDFSAIQTGINSQPVLSTRIILLSTGNDSITGLTAEKVLNTKRFPESVFISSSSSKGMSNQQIVTEDANVPVINPAELVSAIKKESSTEKQ
jgi:chemotaxis signal transduction protein